MTIISQQKLARLCWPRIHAWPIIRSKYWLLTICRSRCYEPDAVPLPSDVASTTGSATAHRRATCAEFSCALPPDNRTRVLFINSALLSGADTWIHLLLLRNLSQEQFELHAAGQPGSPAPAFDDLRAIPGITLRRTNFGPSLWRRSSVQKLASIANAIPAAASLLGLVAYI